jgi:hypothetical protein
VDGDEVIVAPGTYVESVSFLGKAITLRSQDGPEVTIIDGAGVNPAGVWCTDGEGPDTIFDGFTVTSSWNCVGGAMIIFSSSSPTVINCRFVSNPVAGIVSAGDPIVIGCTFEGNSGRPMFSCCSDCPPISPRLGGGVYIGGGSPTVINCTFSSNSADGGGGMYNMGSPTVINGTFSGNVADGGGGMYNIGSPTVINGTFSGNVADDGGGMLNLAGSPTVTNCILWGDTSDEISDYSSSLVVTYSNVQGDFPGEGNIDADPLFVDPDNGDFRLSASSPCIDAGLNDAVACVITDLHYNDRFADDPSVPDCQQAPGQCGIAPIVDMGAIEVNSLPVLLPDCNSNNLWDECEIDASFAPDCNGNGVPDACDIMDGTSEDCNGNTVPDSCDLAVGTSADLNGNGMPDECELDCNGNGSPDDFDIASGQSSDCNGNLVPDECDLDIGQSADCNGNGVPDDCDLHDGTSVDCNDNGIPDDCSDLEDDCNTNGVPDECDIADETSDDVNESGIPDECECLWDCSGNDNGEVDVTDFFVLQSMWGMVGVPCDFDGNGVDVVDFFALLANWGPCP